MAQPQTTQPRKTLMRWIVGTSLNYRFLVVAVGALLMVFGVATLPSTRVDAFPEFAPPRVVIQTACLGLSTSDVEQLVTVPLEQALNGVEGLDDMRSKSVPQLSAIELTFKPDVDELNAWIGLIRATPAGPDTYGRFMRVRDFDCWMHLQDIRDALGQPAPDPAGPSSRLALG